MLHSFISNASLAFIIIFLCYILLLGGSGLYLIPLLLFAALNIACHLSSTLSHSLQPVMSIIDKRRRCFDWLSITHIVWLAIILRFGWALYVRPLPHSDFFVFHEEAMQLLAGNLHILGETKSPVTVILYSLLSKLPFDNLLWIYSGGSIMGGLQCYLIYRIGLELYRSHSAALLGAILISVFPSLVMHSPLPSSEMPFVVIMLALFYCVMRANSNNHRGKRFALIMMVFIGIVSAILHLTRNTGLLYMLVLLITFWIYLPHQAKTKLKLTGTTVAITLAILLPLIIYNFSTYGYFSVNSTKVSDLNLLFGTNMEHSGQYNTDDLRIFQEKSNSGSGNYKEVKKEIRELAFSRIKEDPFSFFKFAAGEKFKAMWCGDAYVMKYYWTDGIIPINPRKNKILNNRLIKKADQSKTIQKQTKPPIQLRLELKEGLTKLVSNYYRIFLAVTLLSLALYRKRSMELRFYTVVAAGVIFVTFMLHLFIEVQPRYHFFLPFVLAVFTGRLLYTGVENLDDSVPGHSTD